MNLAGQTLYAMTFAAVVLAAGCALAGVAFPRADVWGRRLSAVAAVAGFAGLAVRSVEAGHLPIFGTFENTFTAAWALTAAAVLAGWRWPRARSVWRWAVPWAVALLLWGVRYRHEPVPLTISEQSMWVDVHVVFAWLAFVALIGATSLAVLRLRDRAPFGLTPAQADDLLGRLVLLGFLAFTVMLVLGSFYLYVLFGTFWRWEIVETLSLLAWLGYGIVIHGRLFHRWGGRRLATGVLLVLPVLLLAFWVWSVFPGTFHFFDIPLVRPY